MHAFEIFLVVGWSYTLAMTILNVLLIPRLKAPATPRTDGPLVSVVIPARNEERTIDPTVRAMLAQGYPNLEVIVVNDRSTDRTGELLAAIDDPRLTVIHGEEPPPGWLGKPWACDQGCRAAKGELLLIVDADLHYAPDAVAAAVDYMDAHPAIAMAALLPRFVMRGFAEQIGMPMLAVTLFMFTPAWLSNRTTIAAIGLGAGTGNLIRRRDFDDIGGYASLHDAVVDDIGTAYQLRAHGKRTHAVRAGDFISLRMYHGAREIVEGFTKNVFSALGGFITFIAIALLLFCHFLPYVLALRGDVLAIVAVALITLCRLIVFTTLRMRIDNAILGHPPMALFWSWVFLRSAWVTGVRRQVQWRGRSYGKVSRFGKRR